MAIVPRQILRYWLLPGTALLGLPLAAFAETIELTLPIDCEVGQSCIVQNYVDHDPSSGARDYQCGALTYDGHDGTDFRLVNIPDQRAGVNVLAAAKGEVTRVRDGVPDVLIPPGEKPAALDRACGNGIVISHAQGWETQYCHLARGSIRVKPGDPVEAGQPIGRVGMSGQTQFPHLHITVRQRGRAVDPFSYGPDEHTCGKGSSLWNAPTRVALAYRARSVLNTGFASAPVKMEQIESGEAGSTPPTTDALVLVAFVRSIGLQERDEQRLSIKGPDGKIIAEHVEKPLDRNKAQNMVFLGKKRPEAGWPVGSYRASYTVINAGRIVLEQDFVFALGK